MTALRFRDSPQDLLLRPRRLPTGMGKALFGAQPFCVPGSRRNADATHAVRNLYHNCLPLYKQRKSCQDLTENKCINMQNMQKKKKRLASCQRSPFSHTMG